MSARACSAADAVPRLSRRDATLETIDLFNKQHTDAQLSELADCLLAHPDIATHVDLGYNQLTDETGVKLARYIGASSTIEWLDLTNNRLGSGTYLALAAALRVNSSLQFLNVFDNQAVDQAGIDAAFVEALRVNPERPAESVWHLYSDGWVDIDFARLQGVACELGHPSLQLVLATRLTSDDRVTRRLH